MSVGNCSHVEYLGQSEVSYLALIGSLEIPHQQSAPVEPEGLCMVANPLAILEAQAQSMAKIVCWWEVKNYLRRLNIDTSI